jgi:hypothetical protein
MISIVKLNKERAVGNVAFSDLPKAVVVKQPLLRKRVSPLSPI